MNVGCKNAGHMINLVAYADDIVLLAPSWRALQLLLTTLVAQAHVIDLFYTVILLPWYFLRRIVDWSLAMISLCLD